MSAPLFTAPYPDTITIEVTAGDKRQGVRNSCRDCPAARALTRAYPPKAGYWIVDSETADIVPHEFAMAAECSYRSPSDLSVAIQAFDTYGRITRAFPGSFTLTLVPEGPQQ